MAEFIVKYLKWAFGTIFLIGGIFFLQLFADTGSIKPVGGVILCFGFVYWMSTSVYEAPKKIFFTSLGIVFVAGFLADFVIVAFLYQYDLNYFVSWVITALALGTPIMAFMLTKYMD